MKQPSLPTSRARSSSLALGSACDVIAKEVWDDRTRDLRTESCAPSRAWRRCTDWRLVAWWLHQTSPFR